MKKKPAPETILEFASCKCQKTMCQRNNCHCKSLNLPCTELCGCVNCANRITEDDGEDEFEQDHTEEDEFEQDHSDNYEGDSEYSSDSDEECIDWLID